MSPPCPVPGRLSASPSSSELLYEDVFAVWEVIWAARHISSEHFVLFIALALVEAYREIIRDNNMDFTDIIKFFNGMSWSSHSSCPLVGHGASSPGLGRVGGISGILGSLPQQAGVKSRAGGSKQGCQPAGLLPASPNCPCFSQSGLSTMTPRRSCGLPGTWSTRCRCS